MGDVVPAVESEGTAAKGQKCPRSRCVPVSIVPGQGVPVCQAMKGLRRKTA